MISASKIIAIDGMGGDLAPESVFKGLARLSMFTSHFIIFGDENILKKHVHLLPKTISYELRHCDKVITSDMDVLSSIKMGKQSSMGMAIQAVKKKEADAVVSSGNTGLYMALSKIILNTIDGISRPAIASTIPSENGGRTVCLDLGANSECNVKNLVDFAIMGKALAISIFDKKNPKIALLNIGTEKNKGSRLVRKTSEILENLLENYIGFVEGTDFGKGNVDVIVTDGFTGNVALKTIEGTAKFLSSELKSCFLSSVISKIGAFLASPALNILKKKIDPRLHNGAILLGLNGIVVKSHGNSDEIGFANAIRFTNDILRNNLFERINEQLNKTKLLYNFDNENLLDKNNSNGDTFK